MYVGWQRSDLMRLSRVAAVQETDFVVGKKEWRVALRRSKSKNKGMQLFLTNARKPDHGNMSKKPKSLCCISHDVQSSRNKVASASAIVLLPTTAHASSSEPPSLQFDSQRACRFQ